MRVHLKLRVSLFYHCYNYCSPGSYMAFIYVLPVITDFYFVKWKNALFQSIYIYFLNTGHFRSDQLLYIFECVIFLKKNFQHHCLHSMAGLRMRETDTKLYLSHFSNDIILASLFFLCTCTETMSCKLLIKNDN